MTSRNITKTKLMFLNLLKQTKMFVAEDEQKKNRNNVKRWTRYAV